eukprot:SAG22_NODE_17267_length_308_cov_0.956938_1_plen_60_part_10
MWCMRACPARSPIQAPGYVKHCEPTVSPMALATAILDGRSSAIAPAVVIVFEWVTECGVT